MTPGCRARAAITPARHDRMPYRVFLAQIGERLRLAYEGRASGYESARQFRDDVKLIAASLAANKGANAGLFYVRRLLRRIDTFGFHLASLDVRQHAGVLHESHRARHRRSRLARPFRRRAARAARARCWRRMRVRRSSSTRSASAISPSSRPFAQARHRYGPEAVGYFIVSGARGADDVLAALLLARWASVYDKRTGAGRARHRAAVRVPGRARALRRHPARAPRRARLPAPSRGARPAPVCAARLLRQQQGGRHCAHRALPSIRRSAPSRSMHEHAGEQHRRVPCARRQHRARRRPHRCAGQSGAAPAPSTACCACASRARRSSRATACGRSPCGRWSAPSTR